MKTMFIVFINIENFIKKNDFIIFFNNSSKQ